MIEDWSTSAFDIERSLLDSDRVNTKTTTFQTGTIVETRYGLSTRLLRLETVVTTGVICFEENQP
jgi:hypothetical protein